MHAQCWKLKLAKHLVVAVNKLMHVHLLGAFDLGWLTDMHKEVAKFKNSLSSIDLTQDKSDPRRTTDSETASPLRLSMNALNRSFLFFILSWGILKSVCIKLSKTSVLKKNTHFFCPFFKFRLRRRLTCPSGVIKEHSVAWRGILCHRDAAGHWSNVKDKKLVRVIEFHGREMERVDESRGGLKKRNDSIPGDSYTTGLPGSD